MIRARGFPGLVDGGASGIDEGGIALVEDAQRRQLFKAGAAKIQSGHRQTTAGQNNRQTGPVKGAGDQRAAPHMADAQQMLDIEKDVGHGAPSSASKGMLARSRCGVPSAAS